MSDLTPFQAGAQVVENRGRGRRDNTAEFAVDAGGEEGDRFNQVLNAGRRRRHHCQPNAARRWDVLMQNWLIPCANNSIRDGSGRGDRFGQALYFPRSAKQ
jgi:hypothetical protein